NQDRVFAFRAARIQPIVGVLVALFFGITGTSNLYASTSPLTIAAKLPSGIVGLAYSGSIVANGGVAPYAFRVLDGALPGGLYLNGTTGAVTGKHAVAITKYFWVNVTAAH